MRPPSRLGTWLLCAGLAACGGNPPAPASTKTSGSATPTTGTPATTATASTAAPAPPTPAVDGDRRATSKPGAPIDLALVARPLEAGAGALRYELVLTATPRRDLERVELAIDGRPAIVAAATAGAVSEARATIELAAGEGKDVIATAVVMVDGRRMGAATQVRVGAPAPAEPTGRILQLPDGTRVQEVRP